MDTDNTTTYWLSAIGIVALVVLGVWWFTTLETAPLVPNTGETATTSATGVSTDPLEYETE